MTKARENPITTDVRTDRVGDSQHIEKKAPKNNTILVVWMMRLDKARVRSSIYSRPHQESIRDAIDDSQPFKTPPRIITVMTLQVLIL